MAPVLCDRCNDIVQGNEEETPNGWDPLDELAQLDPLLERLIIKRYDVKRKINQLHSPIVRQLPPDVMSNIFEFCLLDFADFQPSSLPARLKRYVSLTIGAVCKYWREIAWSTPRLWSSLMVHVTLASECDLPKATVQEWLARSGQLPLSIRVFSTPHIPVLRTVHQAVSRLADIINQYCTRWSDLDLCVPQVLYRYFHATDNHAPILKSIRFHHSECIDEHDTCHFQLTCPRLQKASLSLLRMHGINIQWDNLTHLDLKDMWIRDCLLILRKTPQLVFCAYSCADATNTISAAAVPVLTSLRSLQLGIMNHFTIKFLDYLISPYLEELSLSAIHINIIAPVEHIISLINRSACSLHSFSLFDTFVPSFEGLMNLLQSMPSLKKLSIMASNNHNLGPWNILKVVARVVSSQSAIFHQGFLPNLEILEYTGKMWPRPGSYDDLYSLLPTNHSVQGPLRLIKLDFYPAIRIPEDSISFFSRLTEQGITLNVCSRSQDILQSSIDYYGGRERPLRGDWVDDLDLGLMQDLPSS